MDCVIRQANENDIRTIRRLAFDIWPATYSDILSSEQIRYMLDLMYSEEELKKQFDHNHRFLLVYRNNQPVGFAGYSERGTQHWHLNKIYLSHSEKGKGTGKKLIEYIIRQISCESANCLSLNVNRHNKTRGFYEHLGFTIVKEEDIAIGEGYFMNDFVMEKRW